MKFITLASNKLKKTFTQMEIQEDQGLLKINIFDLTISL